MIEWIRDHQGLLGWLGVISAITFVGTLLVVPVLVVRIPTRYFARTSRRRHGRDWRAGRHPVVRIVLLGLKNAVGVVFIAGGIAMLVLPGQGLLTILVGMLLLNFPGKFRFERWVASRGPVRRGLDWIRRRAGRPPLAFRPWRPRL